MRPHRHSVDLSAGRRLRLAMTLVVIGGVLEALKLLAWALHE